MRISSTNTIKVNPIAPIGEKKMKQYWMKVQYTTPVACDNPQWILTQGTFRNPEQVLQSYQHQAKALNYEILEEKAAQ